MASALEKVLLAPHTAAALLCARGLRVGGGMRLLKAAACR
jgi:hypothetical protein